MSGFNQSKFNQSPYNRPDRIAKSTSDTLTPALGENSLDPSVTMQTSDSLAMLLAEYPILTATLPTSTDDLTLAIVDIVAALAKYEKLLLGTDSLALYYPTESTDLGVTLVSDDTLIMSPFVSYPLRVYPLGEDTLPIRFGAETSSYEEWFIKRVTDALAIQWATETGSLSYSSTSQDDFAITFDEEGDWIDFWRACNLARRRIYGKAEITFSDPFAADGGVTVTAPEHSYPSTEGSLTDGIEEVPGKWFTFRDNKLDGTSLLCPDPEDFHGDYATGWWSNTLSNGSGVFDPPLVITLEFPARPLYEVKLIGDPYLGGLPKNFIIKIYAGETLLNGQGDFVYNNTNYNFKTVCDPTYTGVTKIEYTINSIAEANAQCRILELFSAHFEEYNEDEIKSIKVFEELDYQSGSIPIGNISSNEIVLTLHNKDHRFDPSNPTSPIRSLMLKHRRIKASLGVYLSPTTGIVWQPMGVFYSTDWSAPDDSPFVEIMGLDRLEILRSTDFAPQGVYNNYTIGDILEEVFESAGVTTSEYIIDTALYGVDYKIPYAWFDRTTSWFAVQKLAENALAYVYCDRDGKINVKLYTPGTTPVVEFNRDNYFTRDHPLRWSEMVNSLEVIAKPRTLDTNLTEVYSDDETFLVAAGQTVERFYMFNQTPVYGQITTTVTADVEGLTFDSDPYPWSVRMWYINNTASDITISHVKHEGHLLIESGGLVIERSNQDSINHNGKVALDAPLEFEFIQTRAQAERIADTLIEMYSDPQRDVELNARGYLSTMLGDRIGVSNYQDDPAVDYNIVRQEIEWTGPLRVNITARKVIEEE